MKLLIFIGLFVFVAARPANEYSRYENFNVNQITDNRRLLSAYVKCFLSTGKCTPEGNDFKKWIPEAIQSNCAKCSEKQKMLIARVVKAIVDKMPQDWQKLSKLHDPDGKLEASIQQFIKKYGS